MNLLYYIIFDFYKIDYSQVEGTTWEIDFHMKYIFFQ